MEGVEDGLKYRGLRRWETRKSVLQFTKLNTEFTLYELKIFKEKCVMGYGHISYIAFHSFRFQTGGA